MKQICLTLLFGLVFVSCNKEEKSEFTLFERDASHYDSLINKKSMPSSPDLSEDISLMDSSYPVQIALYQDGNFYYDLPNLGEGTGKYHYEDGVLKLSSIRTILFKERTMRYQVESVSADAEQFQIRFKDRFRLNLNAVEVVNKP